MGSFYARKLKFGMPLTKTLTFNSALELPMGHALGWGLGSECLTDQIEHWKIIVEIMHPDVVAIWAKTK